MKTETKAAALTRLCSRIALIGAALILIATALWITIGSTNDTASSLQDVKDLCSQPQSWRYLSDFAGITDDTAVTVQAGTENDLLTLSSAYTADGVTYHFIYTPENALVKASYREEQIADGSEEYLAVYEYSDKARSEDRTLAGFTMANGAPSKEDSLALAAEEFAAACCALIAANTGGGLSVLWLLMLLLGAALFIGFGIASLILKRAPGVDESRDIWGDRIR